MHPEATFLRDLAVVLLAAGLVALLFRRLKLPAVLGYIAAGLLLGPHTPPFMLVSDPETIETLAKLGVVVMMYALGLEFDLARLKRVGGTALSAAGVEILVMLFAGFLTGRAFGWGMMDSLFLGAIVSISSTTIIVKTFGELGLSKERFAELVFGVLLVEDIVAILLLALLSSIAMTGSFELAAVGLTLGKLTLFVAVTMVLGLMVVPRLMREVARAKSPEMMLVTTLGFCFGLALLAVKLGFSEALGAFIAGALIAESGLGKKVEHLTEPVRDMFGAVFFVAIGLLIDPRVIAENFGVVAVITTCVLVGKTVGNTVGSFLTGNDRRTSLRVGMSMANIGEFSFIIASLGLTTGVTDPRLYPIVVSVSVLTTLATPFMVRGTDRLMLRLEAASPPWLLSYLDTYSAWTARRAGMPVHPRSAEISAMLARLAVNVSLIAAIFLGAALALRLTPKAYLFVLPPWMGGWATVTWVTAAVGALPLLYGTVRKLWAVSEAAAEVAGARAPNPAGAAAVRVVVQLTVVVASHALLLVYFMFLSSTIAPLGRVFGVLVSGLVVLAVIFRRRLSVRYAEAQSFFIARSTPPPLTEDPSSVSAMLRGVQFTRLVVRTDSTYAGQRIMDLRLRSETGATVVAIERPGNLIVNPEPTAVIEPGDQLLLLGNEAQVAAAKARLGAG